MLNLEGPSTQYLRIPAPTATKGMFFGTRYFKHWVLGPSWKDSSLDKDLDWWSLPGPRKYVKQWPFRLFSEGLGY